MKPSELLRQALELIDAPEKWTQGAYARTSEGDPVIAQDSDAVCFCSVGALRRVDKSCLTNTYSHAYDYLDTQTGGVIPFNDSRTHTDVTRAFKDAIAHAEKEGE